MSEIPNTNTHGLTRREAATLMAAGGPLLRSAAAASEQVVYGVIGTGSRGEYLLRHLNGIGAGRCAAVADVYEPNLRKGIQTARSGKQGYADYRALLDRKDIDAVFIATPLYTHFPITRDALLAGKHVFCEKCLVFKPHEVRQLRELASARDNQILQVGLQRRYSMFYQTARQMVSKGMLGEVTEIHAQWNRNPGWTMLPDQPRERNWRLFREFSGGLTSELASHQIDVANWMFADTPEFITGVGSLDWRRDGRDVYDTIALILKYPGGRRMTCSASSMSRHLPFLGGSRKEFGEVIMGTEGSIEITVGDDEQPAIGLWFYEAGPVVTAPSDEQKEMAKAVGATITQSGRSPRGFPILFARDQISGEEPFFQREMKYARRWLYSKGIMVPQEERNPVDVQLETFLQSCRSGKQPKAGLETGLDDAAAVILANLAMDQGRRVYFNEMEKMARR
ncbi:MAG: Gfo/Idh/MocA family oxidoreductase [Acidobacteria bacterium]|jgi:predicted dehydrogenase|nr:Gfo/Idh/MocA family oxidoreductase [Acidobacteriota bacterium]